VYVGETLNNKGKIPHGKGKNEIRQNSGLITTCEGDFVNGNMCGNVVITWCKEGAAEPMSVYEGEARFSVRHGKGILRSPEGTYEGQFKDDSKHGTGKYTYADGMVHEGRYKCGQPNGPGKMFDGRGTVMYEGNFVNGQYTGPVVGNAV
jgi:hypothetical protein